MKGKLGPFWISVDWKAPTSGAMEIGIGCKVIDIYWGMGHRGRILSVVIFGKRFVYSPAWKKWIKKQGMQ